MLGSAQAATEVAVSCCLLDLPVAESVYSTTVQHSKLPLSSTTATTAALSGQLFPYTDPSTHNGKDESTETDHIPVERLSINDSGALLTLNDTELSEPAAGANHLSADNDADILSKINEALKSYTDASSEAV